MPKYPELEKVSKAREDGGSQQIGEFLDWMSEQGIVRARRGPYISEEACDDANPHLFGGECTKDDGCPRCHGEFIATVERNGWHWDGRKVDDLLNEYFDIDPVKVEDERRALLEEARAAQERDASATA